MTAQSPTSFDDVWAFASRTKGWLTEDQAAMLWDQASRLDSESVVLEIGSHHGRSTMVLAAAMADKKGTVVAVDPFVEGRLFGGLTTRTHFEDNLRRVGLRDQVDLVTDYSTELRPSWTRAIDMLYIDGKHDVWTAGDDLKWRAHLPQGAPVLVHDAFSSVGVTLAILLRVLPSNDLVYEGREGSLALFRLGTPGRADRFRLLKELPWWAKNVLLKMLLRLRLRPVAAMLGHRSPYDPY